MNGEPVSRLTVIPDIHADLTRLHRSIDAAQGRNIAFLGDFIDAGSTSTDPNDNAVLNKVRSLVENTGALAVMGNHELNAILFHRRDKNGAPLRRHSPKNVSQHASFLEQLGFATPAAIEWTQWFLTLPLWIELEGLRLVHACWDQTSIDVIKLRRPDGRLRSEDLDEIALKKTAFAKAVESVLSGPEVALPEGYQFYDSKNNPRRHVRLAWWKPQNGTWRDLALAVPNVQQLPDTPVTGAEGLNLYSEQQIPVLVGHYKMKGDVKVEVGQAACLDYPDAPCVYNWAGERKLKQENISEVSKIIAKVIE